MICRDKGRLQGSALIRSPISPSLLSGLQVAFEKTRLPHFQKAEALPLPVGAAPKCGVLRSASRSPCNHHFSHSSMAPRSQQGCVGQALTTKPFGASWKREMSVAHAEG